MHKYVVTPLVLGASLAFSSAYATDNKPINDFKLSDNKDSATDTLVNGLGALKVSANETGHNNVATTINADGKTYDPVLTIYMDTLASGRFDRYGYENGFKGYYPYELASRFSVGYSSGYSDGSASHDYGAYGYNDALYQRAKQHRKEKRDR